MQLKCTNHIEEFLILNSRSFFTTCTMQSLLFIYFVCALLQFVVIVYVTMEVTRKKIKKIEEQCCG